ncbi:squalene--hopene cyclase [Brevibacillus brevis]|uniref:Squalene--hopene cyclase n=1 Tax=Brevibacillus brevis TaxID=1393 RepID=A0ABY9SYA5_BREBE|nr:squalene--hopene cyclase [Brevibacillus brevis]WNC12789.1 squalene--hopene cyclase [Brevibacillus brevis]
MIDVRPTIRRMQQFLVQKQEADGSWRFCLESGTLTDTHMIILLRTLGIHDEELVDGLARRIASRQLPDGSWKLYADEPIGNLTATVDSYYALLFSGRYAKNNPRMAEARAFIRAHGGLTRAGLLTKITASVTGQYQWPRHFLVPVELALLPPAFPLSFYDFVGYARVHLAPMMILADRKYVHPTSAVPDLSDLFATPPISPGVYPHRLVERFFQDAQGFLGSIHDYVKRLPFLPRQLREVALRRLENYMLKRIEADGTLYTYSTSTYLMIFALLAQGYPPQHPRIVRAIQGLKAAVYQTPEGAHLQLATSAVWDTALLAGSLQASGMAPSHPAIQRANRYLLGKQQTTRGDWTVRNPGGAPGGWGFSDQNTMNPDTDDTTAALRAIQLQALTDPLAAEARKRGIAWLLSMQNVDGGWPAFEKNTDSPIIRQLPIEGADTISTDPSSADLTGRALEFLGKYAGLRQSAPPIRKATRWLLDNQRPDGSWYGRWGIAFLYGTWAALTGLMATGFPADSPSVQKAVNWLLRMQNADGGWGESCLSDERQKYVALGASTPSQTAWAVDALVSVFPEPPPAVERGIAYLLSSAFTEDWTTAYPTGGGRPGGVYFAYHSYRWIWPLLALAHYQEKYVNSPL